MEESNVPRISILQGSWLEPWVHALAPLLIYVLLSYGLVALMPIAGGFGDDVEGVFVWGEITICIIFAFWYGKVSFERTNDFGQFSLRVVLALIVFTVCLCLLSVWASQMLNVQDASHLNPMVLLVVIVIAPIIEEIVFRGFLFTGLCHLMDMKVALVLSSLAFAVGHMGTTQVVCAFAIGIVLSALLLRFRTLWIPIVMHIFLNMAGCLGDCFEVPFAIAVVSALLVAAIAWWLYKTR